MLLDETGGHGWLGRHSDPTDDELAAMAGDLARRGLGAWLCVTQGQYWSEGPFTVFEVRRLADGGGFAEALERFLARRREAVARV